MPSKKVFELHLLTFPLQLNCEAGNSHPPAKITWFKNGRETQGGLFSHSQGKFGGVRLTQIFRINEGQPLASKNNGENYTCIVANPAINGKNITRHFKLTVRCKSFFLY